VSNRLKLIYSESWRQKLSIGIYMGPIGGVGGSGGVQSFWPPPSKNLLGHSGFVNISSESSAQARSIETFFEQIGLKGGSVDMSKSQRHTRVRHTRAGRGVSQANEAAIYPKLTGLCQLDIVSGILKKWKQCWTVQASYGCLVGHVCMGVRISIFPP
jgi:hypothetical protein